MENEKTIKRQKTQLYQVILERTGQTLYKVGDRLLWADEEPEGVTKRFFALRDLQFNLNGCRLVPKITSYFFE